MGHRARRTCVAPPQGRVHDQSFPRRSAGLSHDPVPEQPGCASELGGWFPDGVTEHLVDRIWAAVNAVPLPRPAVTGWTR